ncbi:DNA methyltransferase [Hydrogenobaculum acidophilum]
MECLERIEYNEFDFKEFRASNGRYSIHDYPAMLHYLLVNYLLTNYSNENSLVYDPFCGSGVSIVESSKLNRRAIGTDINPLALLITDVRASNINANLVRDILDRFYREWDNLTPDVPEVKNLNYWFKDYVIKDLGKIRSFLKKIKKSEIFKFLLVAFSQTVRNVSNNRKNEFKRYRLSEEKLKKFMPDVKSVFVSLIENYLKILEVDKVPSNYYRLLLHDVRKPIPIKNVDLVITSPPYGDSKTTVAYGQFSSFSFDWLKGINPYGDSDLSLDNLSIGGKLIKELQILPSHTLHKTIKEIERIDLRRSLEVYSFFNDYYLSLFQIVKTLNSNAYVCFIVGNRMVRNIQIEMDFITAELFESLGLNIENIFIRKISNKRMPLKNSPSNINGKTSNTILHEYIVIMKKS